MDPHDSTGIPKRRKKTSRACLPCQKAHLTCDNNKPCTRCVKKGKADMCTDGVRKKAKYLMEIPDELLAHAASQNASQTPQHEEPKSAHAPAPPSFQPTTSASDLNLLESSMQWLQNPQISTAPTIGGPPHDPNYVEIFGRGIPLKQMHPVRNIFPDLGSSGPLDALSNFGGALPQTQSTDSNSSIANALPQPGSYAPLNLSSNPFSQPSSMNMGMPGGQQPLNPSANLPNQASALSNQGPLGPSPFHTGPPKSENSLSADAAAYAYQKGFFPLYLQSLTMKDPSLLTQEYPSLALRVLKTNGVFDFESIAHPYPYDHANYSLIHHLRERFSKEEMVRMVRAFASFRPSVIAAQSHLSTRDLIFVERELQRSLLDLDKMIRMSGTPTAVWRWSGELCLVNKEFSFFSSWPAEKLIGHKFIYEIMDTSSAVEYIEATSRVFQQRTSSFTDHCVLVKPNNDLIPCVVSFTVRRDLFTCPALIIGSFLPIII